MSCRAVLLSCRAVSLSSCSLPYNPFCATFLAASVQPARRAWVRSQYRYEGKAPGTIMIIIREITQQDNAAMKEIIQDSLEAHGLDIPGSAYFDPQLGELFQFYDRLPGAHYWVVEMEDVVVGGVGIAPFGDIGGVCELQKLYLRPKAQGRGLSRKLMDEALIFAARHYEQCYLETMHSLTTACILYRKYGFRLLSEPLPGSGHSAMDAWYLKDL
ncbi:hypothetical protein GCM10027580_16830 [Corynebacterium faecale]